MFSSSALSSLLGPAVLLSSTFASPTIPPVNKQAGGGITWQPCPPEWNMTTPSVVCGNLDVPLDYTCKESNELLRLEVAKLPAANGVSKGSNLVNPGGPGIPAIPYLNNNAIKLSALVELPFPPLNIHI